MFRPLFSFTNLHLNLPLSIDLLLQLLLHMLGRLFSVHQLRNRVLFLFLLRCSPSQTLLRSNNITHLCILGSFDGVQHIVLYRVLALKFKDEAFVQFVCHFLQGLRLRDLVLYVRLFDSLSNDLKTF